MKSKPPSSVPNLISCLRILIGSILPFLLLGPAEKGPGINWQWGGALGLFLFGAVTDFCDGWIARRHGLETAFGRILDPTADKIFILSAMGCFAALGVYSYWYLVPIFLREGAVTFCRIAWLRRGHAVGAEKAGKLKLVSQVISVLFSFLYLFFPSPRNLWLNQFFLLLALSLTLYSGYSFFRTNQKLLRDPAFLRMVPTLGVGHWRPFPGTYGSLLGMLFLPLIAHDALLHFLIFLTFLLLAYVTIPRLGLAADEDPLEFVIDETCGVLLAFWMIPLHWRSLLLGFFLFRFFDVTKIFPIRWLEKRRGVHGIMLDDLGAGIYTWLILKILFR